VAEIIGDCHDGHLLKPNNSGHVTVWYKGKRVGLHRYIMALNYGDEAIDGKFICHKCHNPLCANPDHLYIGTRSTNALDDVKRGTHPLLGNRRKDIDNNEVYRLRNECGYTFKQLREHFKCGTGTLQYRLQQIENAKHAPN
jgi:hypothetical protein